jgi:hypothetical protein
MFAFVARARVASTSSNFDMVGFAASDPIERADTSHQISITEKVATLGLSGAGMHCASSLSSGYRRKTATAGQGLRYR